MFFVNTYAQRTINADIAVLEEFYISTGGPNWNYTSMKLYLRGTNLFPSFYNGLPWSFTKDSNNIEYIKDPQLNGVR